MDFWLLLYYREINGEHNRQLYLLKSRGMAHSNQVREFFLSSDGIKLRDAYVGPEGVLTGSARLAQEAELPSFDVLPHQCLQARIRYPPRLSHARHLKRRRRRGDVRVET